MKITKEEKQFIINRRKVVGEYNEPPCYDIAAPTPENPYKPSNEEEQIVTQAVYNRIEEFKNMFMNRFIIQKQKSEFMIKAEDEFRLTIKDEQVVNLFYTKLCSSLNSFLTNGYWVGGI